MGQFSKPSKERIRAWLFDVLSQHRPPPDPVEIRRQLEWRLTQQDATRDTGD